MIRDENFVVVERGLHPIDNNECGGFDDGEQLFFDFFVTDEFAMLRECMPFGSLVGLHDIVRLVYAMSHIFGFSIGFSFGFCPRAPCHLQAKKRVRIK
jgi:hypothetical protein